MLSNGLHHMNIIVKPIIMLSLTRVISDTTAIVGQFLAHLHETMPESWPLQTYLFCLYGLNEGYHYVAGMTV